MTTRTLSNWRAASPDGAPRSPGRPPHAHAERWRALWAVARCVQRQGWHAGWRKIHAELAGDVPLRLVQEHLGALKRRRRAALRRRAERERVHVEVLHRDAVWSQDATHLGKCPREAVTARPRRTGVAPARPVLVPVLGELLRDVASTRTIGASVGPPATGEEVVAMLEDAWAERGELALVWCTDNGPQYTCHLVEDWLADHGVVHLRNLPHTPQHNPWVERGHRELKEDAELGAEVVLESPHEAARALDRSRTRIDEHRPRATRGYRTPAACDALNDPWYPRVCRERFYERACRAAAAAVLGIEHPRARRLAEREAILRTMEEFALVRRTRGGRPAPAFKPEGVS